MVRKISKSDKTINALDIIAREVRTQIMKNEETTTETILRNAVAIVIINRTWKISMKTANKK